MPQTAQISAGGIVGSAPRTTAAKINPFQLIGKYSPEINKKLKRALRDLKKGNQKKTLKLLNDVITTDPKNIDALHLLGRTYQQSGDLDQAENMFLEVFGQAPNNLIINDALGNLYHSQNHYRKAAPHFQKCYELAPDNRTHLMCLAQCFYFMGMNDAAMSVTRDLVNLENAEPCLPEDKRRVMDVLLCDTISGSKKFYLSSYPDVERLFSLEYIEHMKLAPAAIGLLCREYDISDQTDTPINLDALENNTLLLNFLCKSVICDATIEEWVKKVRRALLNEFMATGKLAGHEKLASALGIHNYINEYVYVISEEETKQVKDLCKTLGSPPDNHALLAIGLYRPLISIPGLADQLNNLTGVPETTARLLDITLKDPIEEKAIADNLSSLGVIRDSVSQVVQEQYEENPYPRWMYMSHAGEQTQATLVRQVNPHFKSHACLQQNPLNILVAGSGTGCHPITRARQVKDSRVLAVDISRASLAYGKRMADKLGVKNIEFMQADILNLPELNRKFPVIESVGVLHHMKDPEKGWKVLRDLLEPGGIMRIGLYSQTARKDIKRIREHIVEEQIKPTLDNIRQYRHKLLLNQLPIETGKTHRSRDLHYLSGCRDLLFHAQEHQFTIARIKQALDNLGLRFLGFDLKQETVTRFKEQYPNRGDALDLDKYSAFEEQWPDTFMGMYQFYCTTVESGSNNI